jgi:hypothetical protein
MSVFVSDYLKEFFCAMVKLTGIVKAPFRRNDFGAAILKEMTSVYCDQLNVVVIE